MKKYTMLFSIFLSATFLFGQAPVKDKLNQSERMNDKTNKAQMDDKSQLQIYDDFEGTKVLYYGARTGTLDTLAENPMARMNNNNMNKNNNNNMNKNNNNGMNRDNNTNKNMDNSNTNKNNNNTDNNTNRNNNNTDNNSMGNNTNMNGNMGQNSSMNMGNTSKKCGKYMRSGKTKFDYIKMNLKGKLSDVSTFASGSGTSPKIKMKVYTSAPAGTLIEIQLGKKDNTTYPAGTNSQFQGYTTVSNAWEEIEFTFSQTPRGSETTSTDIDQITLLFNPGTSTSDTYYFDDIMGPALVTDKSVSAD